MYPDRELTRLAAHKLTLRRRVLIHRAQCIEATARLAQPLEWVDKVLAVWRRISPVARFAALPLGFLVQRKLFPKGKLVASLFRWAPLVFGAVRGVRSAVKSRFDASRF